MPLAGASQTTTPIEHVIVIFQENVSFDHYFATYPRAANPSGEPPFSAAPDTPSVNGLSEGLLSANPNATNPFRLDRAQALTCSQNHAYTAEQKAFDSGLMDKFVEFTAGHGAGCDPSGKTVMGYFDGNTVTALWHYAQPFALNDNSFSTGFGPSTPGALNLIAGQTHGTSSPDLPGEVVSGTVIGDPDPAFDDCSGGTTVSVSGPNVGDLPLNAVLSPDGKHLLVSNSGAGIQALQVVETGTGRVAQTIPYQVPDSVMIGLAYSADGKRAYASGGGHNVIHTYSVGADGLLTAGADIALDDATKHSLGTGDWPIGLSLGGEGGTLYVADNLADDVAVVDVTAGKVTTRVISALTAAGR